MWMMGTEEDWRTHYARLRALPGASSGVRRQRRGKEFERVLRKMLDEADMEPRSSYRPAGEEIDGSFLYGNRTMLFEAKWTNSPVPASALYQFKGKLDGKLSGTLGVFISMGGYSPDAVDALVAGKSLNLILFDQEDMDKLARPHCIDIHRALKLKLREAAEKGTLYLPLPPCTDQLGPGPAPRQVIVVEGPADAAILNALYHSRGTIAGETQSPPIVVVAMGLLNLSPVALAQPSLHPGVRQVVIVADGDGAPDQTRRRIEEELRSAVMPASADIQTIVLDSSLEASLRLRPLGKRPEQLIRSLAQLDLPALTANNHELRLLLEILNLT